VTVFGQANHLGISPSYLGQLTELSRLPNAGREMSTCQSAVMLCGPHHYSYRMHAYLGINK